MRSVSLTLDYLPIEQLIDLIDEPNRAICHTILRDNRALFERSWGSRHNHQAWDGGYIDHVTDCMNKARHQYAFDKAFGRPMSFTLSNVQLVLYLHDKEKPWRREMDLDSETGTATKIERQIFRERKFIEYGLILSDDEINGLTYVEGEIIAHSPNERMMVPLASFCHAIDNCSARRDYDYPKAEGDEWTGAGRVRTT